MPNFNKVILMGRVTATPDLRQTPSGTNVTEVNLHLRRKWTNPQGEEQFASDWVDVTFWGRTAETICQYIQKGSPLFIEGRLGFRAWESKEGEKRSKVDVTAENFQFISPPPGPGGAAVGRPRWQPSLHGDGSRWTCPPQLHQLHSRAAQ